MKERLRQVIAEMSDEQAEEVLALAESVRTGEAPVDMYGIPWGKAQVDPAMLVVTGKPTIEIPPGIPDVE